MLANLSVGRIPLLVLLLSTVVCSAASGGIDPNILESNRDALRFDLEIPAPEWRPGIPGEPGQQVWEVVLPGFASTGIPGRVRVPRAGGWLVVPPGTTPRLDIVRENWQPAEGRRLALEPVPVMRRDEQTGEVFETPLVPRPGQPLPDEGIPATVLADMARPDPALTRGPAVRLGEVSWWRGRRIVSYTVLPARASADGLVTETLRGGEWRVRFVDDPDAGKSAPRGAANRRGNKGDKRFAGFMLNGELMLDLPTEASHRGRGPAKALAPAAKGTPLGYPDVRLPVLGTQLHRVRASELMDEDLIPSGAGIQEGQIRLYQRRYVAELDDPDNDQSVPYVEVEVPIHMVGEGDAFDGDDLFLFWGLRLRDDGPFNYTVDGTVYELGDAGDPREISNEANIYWLQLADPDPGENWSRMEQVGLNGSAGAPLTTYRRTDYYNEAVAYRENVPNISMDRYYYNTQLDDEAPVNLTFWAPVLDQTGATVRAGISNYAGSGRTVVLDLVSEGNQVATLPDFYINVLEERIYEETMPAVAFATDGVQFRMRNSLLALPIFSYLDWVEVEYDAYYDAPFGRLRFPGGNTTGTANLEIPGFTTDDVGVVEITDPREPRFVNLTGANLVPDGGGYKLSLQVAQPSEVRQFYTTARMTSNGVIDVRYNQARLTEGVVPTELADGSADVLVVAHPDFRERAEQWIEYRRERAGTSGLTFQLVEPQVLFDWYSGGLKNPYAIKRFVNHALDSSTWGTWSLMLIGDANENPRELGVLSSGRIWSHDWVPTHYHVQGVSNLPPEVLASDEWYANQDADEGIAFPGAISEPPDLYVGRIPCNSNSEFDRVFTKIQQVENAQPGENWRRRGIFIADDAWSSGTLSAEGFTLEFQPSEVAFKASERYMARLWAENAGMVALEADTMWLESFMEPIYPDEGSITLTEARQWCEASGAPQALIAALSAGGTLAHYQGHANHWLMAHETWFQHDLRFNEGIVRRDVDDLTNVGKPWLFCGMGCHLGDFVQNVAHPSGNVEPGMGEKMLFFTDAGAVAVYASSGYEYLGGNKLLSELFLERMTQEPPAMDIQGEVVTSRWMLGELMWASESDLLAASQSSTSRAMVYQYVVLGDPLMYLDCGAPEVDAELVGTGGGAIEGEVDLVATDGSGVRMITLQARDEAGIDRLRVHDTGGADLTGDVVTSETPYYDNGSRQIIDYELTVPVRPFAHQVMVMVHDSAARSDATDNVVVTLNVEQTESTVTAIDGQPLDPTTFVFTVGEPVDLEMTVESAAWFDDATVVVLTGTNVDLSAVDVSVANDHTLQVNYTATAVEEKVARSVDLSIDGFVTTVELEGGSALPPSVSISGLVNFPNPMVEETRFTFGTSLHGGRGSVRVWTVSGRSVVEVPFSLAGSGHEIVSWNGRDREGDRLANGTYLYRVEIESTAGQVRSDMQRLVIMR